MFAEDRPWNRRSRHATQARGKFSLQVQLERVRTVRAGLCLAVVRLTIHDGAPVVLEEKLGCDNNDAGTTGEDKDDLRSCCMDT